MSAERIAFALFDANGAPKTDAAPTFALYRDRSAVDRAQPAISNLGLGLYGFTASAADVVAATAFVISAGADAFAASGSTRVFGSVFPRGAPWFLSLLEDAAGALWAGAPPALGAWRDFAGGADATQPAITLVAAGLWGFTPSAADLVAGRAFRWDAPAGAYPQYLYGSAHYEPELLTGATLSDYGEAMAINAVLPDGVDRWLALFTELPNDGGAGGVEAAGSGYARALVAGGWTSFSADVQGRRLAAAVEFPVLNNTLDGVVGWGIYDAAVAGNLLAFGPVKDSDGTETTVNLASGDTPRFLAGQLAVGIG